MINITILIYAISIAICYYEKADSSVFVVVSAFYIMLMISDVNRTIKDKK